MDPLDFLYTIVINLPMLCPAILSATDISGPSSTQDNSQNKNPNCGMASNKLHKKRGHKDATISRPNPFGLRTPLADPLANAHSPMEEEAPPRPSRGRVISKPVPRVLRMEGQWGVTVTIKGAKNLPKKALLDLSDVACCVSAFNVDHHALSKVCGLVTCHQTHTVFAALHTYT